MASVVHVIATC